VLAYQREAIAAAFQCPVRETYGLAEMVLAASECPAGRLHQWPEVGVIEVFEGDQPVAGTAPGELVCTGLLNTDMPLIRYRVGDRGTRPVASEACACGRTLPTLAPPEGRLDDVLYTRDGRRVGRLDPVFKARLPVREAQIVQETLDRIRIRFVAAPDFTLAAAKSIVDRLHARLGPVEVIFEPVEQIPRTPSGKFRAVICELPASVRASLGETPGCMATYDR
jgi:phenylacetate-CoA ligase